MKFQGLDPECGIWLYIKKLPADEDNNKVLVRWDGYNVETWLNQCEIRAAITKRPLKPRPKKGDWPTVKHPSQLQRFDKINVVTQDGTTSEPKIVYINDPYKGHVITTCKETIKYELLSEWTETSLEKTSDTLESIPPSPRSPSPPPPWTPEDCEEPAIASTSTKRRKGDKTSLPGMINTDQTSKRKSTATVAVTKKTAKVLSKGAPRQVTSSAPQITSATCSVSTWRLQRSKELLQQKKDEATTRGTSEGNDVVPQRHPLLNSIHTIGDQSRNEVENASIATLKSEVLQLRTMIEALQQHVKKVEADVTALSDVVQQSNSHQSVSLSNTSAIFAETMEVLNDDSSFADASLSALPTVNSSPPPISSTGFIGSSSPLASTSLISVTAAPNISAIPNISATPSQVDGNIRQSTGASELSQTFIESLSCYADRPSVVARKLVGVIFTRRETESCNCNGSHGREGLPPEKLASLRKYLFEITQTPSSRQAAVWKTVTTSLDASFRSQRAYKKKKQLQVARTELDAIGDMDISE